jgi:hypothetical protein
MANRRKEEKKRRKRKKQGESPPSIPTIEEGKLGARAMGQRVATSLLSAVVRGATQAIVGEFLSDDLHHH